LSHHEKYDGSGYPNGLKGDSIPLYGRIVAVADVFDALISQRVYKNSWTLEQTVEYLKSQSGIHFDPIIVEKFLEKIDEAEDIFKSLMPEK
ncbi:MAG: two-component system response regulator, partial [Mucispirillum sp.]|nr:two-component system response regulator [Mucispirillum sp.]